MDSEESDNGAGNYTITIVELEDGSIVTPTTDRIRFIKEETKDGINTNGQ